MDCKVGVTTGFLYIATRGGVWLLLVTVSCGAAETGAATPVKISNAATFRTFIILAIPAATIMEHDLSGPGTVQARFFPLPGRFRLDLNDRAGRSRKKIEVPHAES